MTKLRPRVVLVLALLALSPIVALAQLDFVITTIAGSSYAFAGDGGPATAAQLSQVYHVVCDPQGNVLVADRTNHQVVRISPSGMLRVIAGNGVLGFSGDGGAATRASLAFPSSLALDAAGNLYITDAGNYRIRKVNVNGTIETIAGTGLQGVTGDDGSALAATFDDLRGVAVDAGGNVYVSDHRANRIRRISTAGVITNFAGTGEASSSGDGGQALNARINGPWHLHIDAQGNLFIPENRGHRVRMVSPQGVITTVAGRGVALSDGNGGPATQAAILGPTSVHKDAAGNLYITDFFDKIRIVSPGGLIETFAGGDDRGFSGDGGQARNARLNIPLGVAGDTSGNIFIADSFNVRIRRVGPTRVIQTVGGNGQFRFSGDGGPAVAATFAAPFGLTADIDGNVYIADSENHRVRRIAPDGTITTIAGIGQAGFSGDGGQATQAALNYPLGLAVDGQKNLYISDNLNQRVRRVSPMGIITTVAGGGNQFVPPDGTPALQMSLAPVGLAVDGGGNLLVLDSSLCAIVHVSAGGVITRFAGTYLQCGSSGDGGLARNATLQTLGPNGAGIALDADGTVYVAEGNPPANAGPNSGGRVRRIRNGIIQAFAGNGTFGVPLDGASAVNSPLLAPESLTTDGFGGVYIGDTFFVYGVASNGQIFRLAGDSFAEASGDGGLARSAAFLGVRDLTFDRAGNLVFLDAVNYRARAILAELPTATISSQPLRFTGDSGGAVTPPQNIALTASIPGIGFDIATTTPAPWLRISPQQGSTPRLVELTVDPGNLAPGNYNTTLSIRTPLATPPERTRAVNLTVRPASPPQLKLDKDNLSFTLPRDAAPRPDTLMVSNAGGGALDVTVGVSTESGGAWLSVNPSSGRALPGQPLTLTVTANPAGLAPGTYTGRITVQGAGTTLAVPVTITVSANDRAILLSQTGIAFTAVAAGGVVPPRTFEVINTGRGVVNWSVSTSTLSGGNNWLVVTPVAGATDAAAAAVPSVEVSVRQAGLAPGVYYGLVRVDAPDAANTPQVVTVFLEVLPAGSDPGPIVEPAELVFTGVAGRSPGSQDVFVYNIAQNPKTYRSKGVLTGARLENLPGDSTLAVNRANRVIVQPFVSELPAGVHTGTLSLQFSDGRVRSVRVRVILTGAASLTEGRGAAIDAGCTPTRLLPAVTSLSPSGAVTVGWPVPVTAEVRDDCGRPHEQGAVVVSFSNGDPPIALESLKQGRWSATWPARGAAADENVTLKVEAVNPQSTLRGEETLVLGVRDRQEPPVVEPNGVVSAATYEAYEPLAPGSLISLFGIRLSEGQAMPDTLPLPNTLAGTTVFIGGRPMPLLFSGDKQVNAMVPYDLEFNTRHQILVRRGPTYARPIAVDVAAAQPAIFRLTGTQAHIYRFTSTGQQILADAANPVAAGDVIIIYCAGLGAVNPPVPAGQAAPGAEPLARTVNAVRVTVGGIEAPASYTGLAPGFSGLYQINATVPLGVTPGNAVPVHLQVAGQTSEPATIAVR